VAGCPEIAGIRTSATRRIQSTADRTIWTPINQTGTKFWKYGLMFHLFTRPSLLQSARGSLGDDEPVPGACC
jgi:hypothetical protein